MSGSRVILYALGLAAVSILLHFVLPFPYGLYSGLLVFAGLPFLIRKYVRDLMATKQLKT